MIERAHRGIRGRLAAGRDSETSRSIAECAFALKRGKGTQARKARRSEQVEHAVAVYTATTGSGADRAAVRIEAAIRANGGLRAKWTGDDGIRRGRPL